MRICPNCKIKWDNKNLKDCDCPQCKNSAFFTMSTSSTGTVIYLNESNEKLSDYKLVDSTSSS